MFIDLTDKKILVAGGGTIALRRIRTLLKFRADIRVIAPEHEVNRRIWEECRAAGVTVNVADDRSLCDFYFPSIVMTEDTVIGINCGGEDHAKVKETRIKIEEMFGE